MIATTAAITGTWSRTFIEPTCRMGFLPLANAKALQ